MAKFTPEQAADVLAIKQVIYEWGDELDINSGRRIAEADVLTKDVRYNVGGEWRDGLDAVKAFYAARWDRLTAAGGAPVMRHLLTNLRIAFAADDHAADDHASGDHAPGDFARISYQLLFFAATGTPPFIGKADPLAVADVWMECRREGDGHWRISRFDSGQIFQRG